MLRLAVPPRACFRWLLSRHLSYTARVAAGPKLPDKYNYNENIWAEDQPDSRHVAFRRVTANELERRKVPPTEVKMLVRDFIEDSLYNPNYGYFPKQATIVSTEDKSIPFGSISDMAHFDYEVAQRYSVYDGGEDGPGKQVWHTPTELFRPHYGHAIARCIVLEYKLKYFPYEDLNIFEIGAGNGTLARDILDYIKMEEPEVYERTRYNIIEISGRLAAIQREKLAAYRRNVSITHKSIFQWNKTVSSPCFLLALEVIDNFAHDVVRYDYRTMDPYQAVVTIDENHDFGMHYERAEDPLVYQYPTLRKLVSYLPLAPNLSPPEYIPTRLLSLLQTLRLYFPQHRLLLSDFSSLPDTIPGINSPVVQTRFRNTTVPTDTLLVHPGYFDIFFPTDFERLRDMYEYLLEQPIPRDSAGRVSPMAMSSSPLSAGAGFFSFSYPHNRRVPQDGIVSSSGLPVGERKSGVFSSAEFLETYADLSATRLRNGENPLLEYYENVKFLF